MKHDLLAGSAQIRARADRLATDGRIASLRRIQTDTSMRAEELRKIGWKVLAQSWQADADYVTKLLGQLDRLERIAA